MDDTATVRTEDVIAVGDYLKGLLANGGEGAGYEYEGAYRVLSMLGLTRILNDRGWDEIGRDLGVDGPEGLREHLRGRARELDR